MPAARCAALTFHAIDGRESVLALAPPAFRSILARVCEATRVRPLETLVSDACSSGGAESSAFAITFDDGYEGVYSHAFPTLAELGLTATLFITCDWINSGRNRSRRYGYPMLNWSQLRELADSGFRIGCHTLSHPDLRRLEEREIRRELGGAKAMLEDRLQVHVRSLAYPGGRCDARSVSVAGEMFDFACTDELGLLKAGTDRYRLPRVESWYFRRWPARGLLGGPAMPAYLGVRRWPRKARRRLAGLFA